MRLLNIVLGVMTLLVLVGVYGLKYAVEGTAREKTDLELTIARQESELSLLKAEWALLNQPAHIEPIVRRHADALSLAALSPRQFGDLINLPMRPAEPDTEAMSALFESLAAGVDPIAQILAELQ